MIREDLTLPWPAPIRELIDAHPPLPHAEQLALCRRWQQQGDEQARNRLATSTLRFIATVALTYRGRGLELPDLIQEGTLGCMQAIDRFDETQGFKFISYAVHWIRQAIQSALAQQGAPIRHPISRIQATAQALKMQGPLEQQHERPVSLEESAAAARQQNRERGRPYPRADEGLSAVYYSLDAPVGEGNGHALRAEYQADLASDADSSWGVETRELGEIVRALLPKLTDRERYILERYYGLTGVPPRTLDQIGQELGITRERVRQVKEGALKKIGKRVNGHPEEYRELMAE